MKETRNKNTYIGYIPAKSNISSLKAIMNQGRVPLSQYINEKTVNTDNSNPYLSYFDKMRSMLNKGQAKSVHEKQEKGKEKQKKMSQTRLQIFCKNESLKEVINEYQIPKELNFNKEKLKIYDTRWKDRSQSMNARSHPKNQKMKRLQTIANNPIKSFNTQHLVRGHHKTYTQIEAQYQEKPNILQLHRYKSVKKQTINYAKYTSIYLNGEIQPGMMELNQTIGLGANATVRLGKDVKSQRLVAVKIYEKYKLIEPIKKKRVQQEIEILSKIQHQSIIKMLSCYEDKRQIHLIFQYLPSAQTLQDYLKNHQYDTSIQQKNIIATKIIQSIDYLHQHGIFHRDIKPDNIMIGQGKGIKLIDFGFATTATKGETHCGTPNYMAPQLFCKKSIYSPLKVDIWALGILLFYLYEGCFPFKGYDEKDLSRSVARGVFAYKKCTNKMQIIIDSALKVDPGQRKSVHEMQEAMKVQSLI